MKMMSENLCTTRYPVLKWVGGKRKLLPILHENMPEKINNYYELFFGGGALFFSLDKKYYRTAFLNDMNENLINFYKIFKFSANKNSIINRLDYYKNNHSEEFYYKIRDEYNSEKSNTIEKCLQFLYLNKTCFNGLYRVNKKGEFNVPFNGNFINNIYQKHCFLGYFSLFKYTILSSKSYDNFAPCAGDFVYLDPPYYNSDKSIYNNEQFDTDKLFEYCCFLDDNNVKFILSNSNEQYVKNLFSKFDIKIIDSKNLVGRTNKKCQEILIKNY